MKISVITAVRNGERDIAATASSVLEQQFDGEIEYIVIDGASTDGTVAALEPYRSRIAVLLSEPDSGIYDAMNKGISRATGDIIGILNCGDEYLPGAFSEVAAAFSGNCGEKAVFFGDVIYSRLGRVAGYRPENRYRGAFAPHPSMFVPKSVYDEIGAYDSSFRLMGDYDFMYRAVNVSGIKVLYRRTDIARYAEGGLSDRNIFACLREELRVKLKYGAPFLDSGLIFAAKVIKNLPRMFYAAVKFAKS